MNISLEISLFWNYHINMKSDLPARGGAGRGQGRKPLSHDAPTVPVSIKMTIEQKDKLQRLGGPSWVRERIDKAREPDQET